MAGTLSPSPVFTGLDDNGNPLVGGLLYTYLAGTSTPEATYTDVDLSVANTNPIVLDAGGRATIFLSPTSYKFLLKTSAGVTVWTQDDISAVPATNVDLDIEGTAGEVLAAGQVVYLSAGLGSKTAGKWYLADADDAYSSSEAKAVGFAVNAYAADETALIRIQGRVTGLSGLTAGTTYYISATAGGLTSTAPANARAVLVADSTTTGVLSYWLSLQDASATTSGLVNLTTQTLGAGTKSVDKLTFKPGGVATFTANTWGRILGPYVTAVPTSGTSETSCIATAPTILANTLNASGDILRATYYGTNDATNNAVTWRVKIGGTTISTFTFTPNAAVAAWELTVEVHRTSSAANQNVICRLIYSEANGATQAPFMDVDATTKDLATDLTFDVTIQKATAGTLTFLGAYFEAGT